MTTSGELIIHTAQPNRANITFCQLDIDLQKNEPKVLRHDQLPNDGTAVSTHGGGFPTDWHGAEISVMFEGNWTVGQGAPSRANVLKYVRQLAVITPYAEFTLRYSDHRAKNKNIAVRYNRRSHKVPTPPQTVKHHPSSVSLTKLEELVHICLRRSPKADLRKFLKDSFAHVNKAVADELVEASGRDFAPDIPVSSLTQKHWMHLQKMLRQRDWPEPDGECLSPAGGYNMYLGILKEFNPEIVVTHTEPARVFEGHPFVVEAALSLGGRTLDVGINVIRFANRIPLIFEPGSDVISKTATELKWQTYKINIREQKVGVFVSIVSTKIPFKGTGKEFISADCTEIKDVVRTALQKCGNQLKAKIVQSQRKKDNANRRRELEQYIPNAANSIFNVLKQCAEGCADGASPPKRPRITDNEATAQRELITQIRERQVSAGSLKSKLSAYVKERDESEALSFMSEQGKHIVDLAADKFYVAQLGHLAPDSKGQPLRMSIGGLHFDLIRGACHTLSLPTGAV